MRVADFTERDYGSTDELPPSCALLSLNIAPPTQLQKHIEKGDKISYM